MLINRSSSTSIEKKTPHEVWSSIPTNYSELKIFRCPAYAHVNNGKLEPRSLKRIFLGFKAAIEGYKLWCPELKKVIISRDVIFHEIAMLHDQSPTATSDKTQQKPSMQVKVDINVDSTLKPTSQPVTTSQQP